jgi:beta-lactamase class C
MGILKVLTHIILFLSVLIITNIRSWFANEEPIDINRVIDNIPSIHEGMIEDYKKFLLSELDTTLTVGASVVIVSHDSVLYKDAYGLRKAGAIDSVDFNTVFRLASVSKGFAGVLACMLDYDNVIDLDEKIIKILPDFKLKDSANTYGLSLKHTLNHTSGIAPHAYDNLVEANVPISEIIARFKEVEIAAAPGEVYGYQNAIFSMIDTLLKVKTGKDYNTFLCEEIFEPLGMYNASYNQESMESNANVAYPHIRGKGKYFPIELNDGYYNVSPAAGVNASINDMTKWLKALLGYRQDVINSNVLNTIASPTVYTPLKRKYTYHWGRVDDRNYSIGWRIYRYLGRDIVYHGGFVLGYRAEIAFCPELKAGIVFLQNSPNRTASRCVPEFWKRYFRMIDETDIWASVED